MHVTSKLVPFTKSSGVGHFHINLVDGSYMGLRERITRVASAQATLDGKTKSFGPHWQYIHHISPALILARAWMDPEISSSKRFSSLPSAVADTGTLNLIMLRMVISEFAKAFPGNMDQIPPPEKVKGITYDQIKALLPFGDPKLA